MPIQKADYLATVQLNVTADIRIAWRIAILLGF